MRGMFFLREVGKCLTYVVNDGTGLWFAAGVAKYLSD